MKKAIVLFYILMLYCFADAVSQNVTIKGKTINAQDKTIEVYRYADNFSKQEVLLDSQKITDNQTIDLEFTVRHTTLVFIQIENYSQSFFVEPGMDYNIVIHQFEWNIDEKMNVYQNPIALPVEFVDLERDDLNFQISAYDSTESEMFLKYRMFLDFRFKQDKSRMDTMFSTLQSVCNDSENEFFLSYKRHRMAELEYMFGLKSAKNIAEQYFKGQPIEYDDEGYASLFNVYFSNFISKGTKELPIETLARWVDENDLFKYMDSIGIYPVLQHEQLRELVALKALQESYYNPYYNSEMVVKMIERLSNESKFSRHREIAENILNMFQTTDKGKELPSFTLIDVEKNVVDLNDLKGKWLYVSFVRLADANSLREIETLKFYRDSVYKTSDMEFLTISCDREFQKLYHFLKNSKKGASYDWLWLHFDNNYKMLDFFGVTTYPHFILIDPEGNVKSYSEMSPGEGYFINSKWLKPEQENKTDKDTFPLNKKN